MALQDNARIATTGSLDTTEAVTMEIMFSYGCHGYAPWPEEHSILIQYSVNNGIEWHLLKELYGIGNGATVYVAIKLYAISVSQWVNIADNCTVMLNAADSRV